MSYQEKPVIEISDFGYWLSWRNRKRFVPCSKKELEEIKASLAVDISTEALEKTKRSFKQGSHEKSFYYRDEDGTICIPADPKDVPAGVRLEEIDNLAAADRVAKEMSEQHYRRFQDHGEFTKALESQLGSPRQHLIERLQNPKSNYERDMVRSMLKELDSGAHDLSRIQSDSYFHWRES